MSHGIPHQIVTDNGPQFVARDFGTICKNNDVKHTKSAPYHQASNSLVKRFVQTLNRRQRRMMVVR